MLGKMSRSTRHKEKYEKSSEIPKDHYHEGTAARTRPLSFDEIMSKRKNKKKLFENEKVGVVEDISRDGNTEKSNDQSRRGDLRSKDSSHGVQKHFPQGDAKASLKKKEKNTFMKNEYSKRNDRELGDSEIKLKAKVDKDLKAKGKSDEKNYGSRKRDEGRSNHVENETLKKHSGDFPEKDRHMNGTIGKSERENKRKYRSGADEKNRDRYTIRKRDLGKVHDSETSDRKNRKELSKSRYEELNLKRRRSRSREHVDRKKRSISPLPRSQKRVSYYSREHEEPTLSLKGRSERQHSDTDKSRVLNNGSSGHYKRHGGSTSGLGGYSPRKRRTDNAAKTPSPPKRSPEKKSAKWDLAPAGTDNTFSVSITSNFQLSNQLTPSNMHEAIGAVSVASTILKPLSVPFGILSTNKNDSIDSVQLTQATRPMRRLYVENIPASASEQAVMEFLNNFLISSGVNHIQGTQPCISCIIHKEKGQALVEFLTPEDASAALSFDGRSFYGSIIKIRRPKDFVEAATGEPEKSVAAVDAISCIVNDTPHKIFIGGFSKALSSKMIMEIASAFGPLKAYHFENSDDLNEPCAFLEYADQSITLKARAGLNGMKLGGQAVTAVQAVPNASPLANSGNPPFYGIPEQAKALLKKPTEVLKLKNVFNPDAFPSLSHVEIEEVLEDVRLECTRFGAVLSVNVVKYSAAPISASVACGVNEDVDSPGSPQNLVCNEANVETVMVKETAEPKIVESNGIEDDKPGGRVMEDETCQPGQSDSNVVADNLSANSIPDSQEHFQKTSKDESECFGDKVIDNIQIKDRNLEDQLPIREESNLEEVSGKSKELLVDDHDYIIGSDAIEKGDCEQQNCDPDRIFEPGCVFIEFRRTEASCMAAHCLHGRLFDSHTVTVEYVPLDVYHARFPK